MKNMKKLLLLTCLMISSIYSADLSDEILSKTKRKVGVCVIIGGNSDIAISIAEKSKFLVYMKSLNNEEVLKSSEEAGKKDLLGKRCFFSYGKLDSISFTDNYIDLLVVDSLAQVSEEEMLRALTPRGILLLIKDGKIISEKTKKFADGVDFWSHWYHNPDNNPISNDELAKGPYILTALTWPAYGADPTMVLTDSGKLFRATGSHQTLSTDEDKVDYRNQLIAYQLYNGSILWKKTLDENYRVYRSCMVALDESFYMIDGAGCLILNPEDGVKIARIDLSKHGAEAKWIAVVGKTLYACVGNEDPPIKMPKKGGRYNTREELSYTKEKLPFGFGHTMIAYDIDNSKILWSHKSDGSIDTRAIGIRDDKLYYYALGKEVQCLNRISGQSIWKNTKPEVIEKINSLEKEYSDKKNGVYRSMIGMLCGEDAVYFFIPSRDYYVALDVNSGDLLWHKKRRRTLTVHEYPNSSLTGKNELLCQGAFYDAKTGEAKSGKKGFARQGGMNCARITGTKYELFRSRGLFYDLEKRKDIDMGYQIRIDCRVGCIPSGGVVAMPPFGNCNCSVYYKGFGIYSPAKNIWSKVAQEQRLTVFSAEKVKEVKADINDWPCFRGNSDCSMSNLVEISDDLKQKWSMNLGKNNKLTPSISVGDKIFVASNQGIVYCINSSDGKVLWKTIVSGGINFSPVYLNGRVFVGCLDGMLWSISAETGKALWSFNVAPTKLLIQEFGKIQSVWPITRALVAQDGIVYAAAGGSHQNGFALHAIEAASGKTKWSNMHSGVLEGKDSLGYTAGGSMVIHNKTLWLCGGNGFSPVAFEIETGKLKELGRPEKMKIAVPTANIGVFGDSFLVYSGVNYFNTPRSSLGILALDKTDKPIYPEIRINTRPISLPIWDEKLFVRGDMLSWKINDVKTLFQKDALKKYKDRGGYASIRTNKKKPWASSLWSVKAIPLALSENTVIAYYRDSIFGLKRETGKSKWSLKLPNTIIKNGISITKSGKIILSLNDGSVVCLE